MNNWILKNKSTLVKVLGAVVFLLSCLFTYGFYKSLSGFIANGFREPLFMLPMIVSYILPAICSLYFFYDFFVRKTGLIANVIYSTLTVLIAIACLVGIFINIKIYASNSAMGVYQTVPFGFPYCGIFTSLLLIALQVINVIIMIKPEGKIAKAKDGLRQCGCISVNVVEYIILSVMAILVFALVGAALWAVNAMKNALYDPRFIFLLVWVIIIPVVNLFLLLLKPENRFKPLSSSVTWLAAGIMINALFGLLLWILEATNPGFMVHVGKPIFSIAFSVSLPIEMLAMVAIMAASTITFIIRLIIIIVKNKSLPSSL